MIIVDVETTGVEPSKHSVVSIGAVDFDNAERKFSIECSAFAGAHADNEALQIIGMTRELIFDSSKPSEAQAIQKFIEWMKEAKDHTIAGQNCYFDLEFLLAATHRAHLNISLPKRIVDLHSVVWLHMMKREMSPPIDPIHRRSNINSDFICDYVGIPREVGPHIGINGALWETEAFSRIFYDKSLLSEFKQYKISWL
ncbi:MAG TPA: 3'-5' exonuclease [Candidatus Paceibacterota bacterium]